MDFQVAVPSTSHGIIFIYLIFINVKQRHNQGVDSGSGPPFGTYNSDVNKSILLYLPIVYINIIMVYFVGPSL